eukprot:5108245-Ditylum_brightwellii.AAC.1
MVNVALVYASIMFSHSVMSSGILDFSLDDFTSATVVIVAALSAATCSLMLTTSSSEKGLKV